ncbi:unnamed protein product, partial [Rotaria sp. Silwood2]
MVLESATWRANPDWTTKLGYSDQYLIDVNRKSIDLLCDVRDEYDSAKLPMVINGCVGPRADGYFPTLIMSIEQAQAYHSKQIDIFSQTKADMVTSFTMNYPEEAIGITLAARAVGMPVAISFTLDVD